MRYITTQRIGEFSTRDTTSEKTASGITYQLHIANVDLREHFWHLHLHVDLTSPFFLFLYSLINIFRSRKRDVRESGNNYLIGPPSSTCLQKSQNSLTCYQCRVDHVGKNCMTILNHSISLTPLMERQGMVSCFPTFECMTSRIGHFSDIFENVKDSLTYNCVHEK